MIYVQTFNSSTIRLKTSIFKPKTGCVGVYKGYDKGEYKTSCEHEKREHREAIPEQYGVKLTFEGKTNRKTFTRQLISGWMSLFCTILDSSQEWWTLLWSLSGIRKEILSRNKWSTKMMVIHHYCAFLPSFACHRRGSVQNYPDTSTSLSWSCTIFQVRQDPKIWRTRWFPFPARKTSINLKIKYRTRPV